MKKRLIALLLAFSSLLGIMAGCGRDNDPEGGSGSQTPNAEQLSATTEGITRGQWITMLGQGMGMEEYIGASAYYSDIPSGSELYPYVQSSYEWGVLALEQEGAFRPDESATKGFIAATAMLSVGTISVEEGATEDEVLASAESNGILRLAGASWDDDALFVDGLDALEAAKRLYLDREEEEIIVSTVLDEVKDLNTTAVAGQIMVNGSEVTIPAAMAEDFSVGTVFVAPATAMDPYGVAMKVTNVVIQGDYAILQTEMPDLGEVFDELNVYGTGIPDVNNVILADGVSMGPTASNLVNGGRAGALSLDDMVYRGGQSQLAVPTKGLNLTFGVNFTKGTVSVAPNWENASLTIDRLMPESMRANGEIGLSPTDELGQLFEKSNFSAKSIAILPDENGNPRCDENGIEQVLTVTDKFKGSYEVTGSLDIKNLYVEVGVEFKKILGVPTDLKRVVVELNCDSEVNVALKGELNEEIKVAMVPIPVAGGIVTVDAEIILYLNASGEVQVKVEVSRNVKFEYTDGNFKRTQTGSQSRGIEATIEIEAGVEPSVTLKALGVELIDAKVKIGAKGSSGAKLRYGKTDEVIQEIGAFRLSTTFWGKIIVETEVALPVISLEVGGGKDTLANKLNITGKWDLVKAENAPVHWKPDALNREWPIWEYTFTIELEGEPEDIGDTSGGGSETTGDPYDTLMIDQIMLTMDPGNRVRLNIISFPAGESMADVRFATADYSVANVDQYGYVTAVGPGVTQVYAETASGAVQACVVTVTGVRTEFDSSDFL